MHACLRVCVCVCVCENISNYLITLVNMITVFDDIPTYMWSSNLLF